jgi:hypothetical protein
MVAQDDRLNVICYSGYRCDETPRRFFLHGKEIVVRNILFQWKSPGERHFKIEGNDGNTYVLTHDEKHWRVTQGSRSSQK